MLDLFFNINYRPLQTSVSVAAKFVAFLRIYLATSKKKKIKKEGAYSALQSAPGLNGTPCGCVTAPFVRRLTVACSHHRHHQPSVKPQTESHSSSACLPPQHLHRDGAPTAEEVRPAARQDGRAQLIGSEIQKCSKVQMYSASGPLELVLQRLGLGLFLWGGSLGHLG